MSIERVIRIFAGAVVLASLALAVTVNLNWRLASPELVHVITDSGSRVVFYGDDFTETVDVVRRQVPPTVRFVSFVRRVFAECWAYV